MTSEISRLLPLQVHDDTTSAEERLRSEIAGLHVALATRATIEQAKGILMFVYQVDDSAAFGILQRWSMQQNIKLRDIAQALIDISVHDSQPCADDAARRAVRHSLRNV